ncbi:hypothetical protein [Streptomyces sp. CAU 1734]|uniref:hypothetical protein n=1 Tax=Streptomyces sp. CAU 1734 TaxID=3140360 RepID=UPI00326099E3
MAAADGGTGGGSHGGPPNVHIGSADNSALNFGSHGSATTNNTWAAGPAADPAQRELLEAVRALRDDLGRFAPFDSREILDAELVATEEEITSSGAAAPGRLERLRGALAVAGGSVAALASSIAVGEAVTALLRG